MWWDRVSKPGSLALESDALTTALCGPAPYYNSYQLKATALEVYIVPLHQPTIPLAFVYTVPQNYTDESFICDVPFSLVILH